MAFSDSCQPQCANGGVCIGHNLCSCPHGFSGPDCQDKTCTVRCENGGVCTMPNNKCKCRDGFYGTRCHKKYVLKSTYKLRFLRIAKDAHILDGHFDATNFSYTSENAKLSR